MVSERVNANAVLRAEEKDKTMRPTPDLEHPRVSLDRLKLFKLASHL
jgi:hypothetical protein